MLGHPILEESGLALPPAAIAIACATVLIAFLSARPPAGAQPPTPNPRRIVHESVDDPSRVRYGVGAFGLVALVWAVWVGRSGSASSLDNPVPAAVLGIGWPMLFVVAAIVRRRIVDDGPHVALAIVPAFAWVWYLAVYRDPTDPRALSTALWIYAVITISGAIAFGWREWIGRAELFALLASWTARAHEWDPPPGATAVLGILLGGLLLGRERTPSTIGLVAACAVGAAVLTVVGRRAAPAMVLAVASLAVATGLRRFLNSVQVLAGSDKVDPNLLGETSRLLLQVAIVVAGHLAGAEILRRRGERGAPEALLIASVALCTLVVTLPA